MCVELFYLTLIFYFSRAATSVSDKERERESTSSKKAGLVRVLFRASYRSELVDITFEINSYRTKLNFLSFKTHWKKLNNFQGGTSFFTFYDTKFPERFFSFQLHNFLMVAKKV